jgi:dynein assembly factor 5
VPDEASAAALLECALLPPLTWRAGKAAAAIRYAAVTALASALRRRLMPRRPLMRLINDGTLLPLLAQVLEEDW